MEFEEFKAFMLQSAAQHEVRIAQIEESLGRVTNTLVRLVDNRIELQKEFDRRWRVIQDGIEATQRNIDATQRQIDSLSRV